jgi:hypothetical protein
MNHASVPFAIQGGPARSDLKAVFDRPRTIVSAGRQGVAEREFVRRDASSAYAPCVYEPHIRTAEVVLRNLLRGLRGGHGCDHHALALLLGSRRFRTVSRRRPQVRPTPAHAKQAKQGLSRYPFDQSRRRQKAATSVGARLRALLGHASVQVTLEERSDIVALTRRGPGDRGELQQSVGGPARQESQYAREAEH